MKHTVTELHDPSEPVLFSDCIMGNYMYELGFGNFMAESSTLSENNQQSEICNVTAISPNCSLKETISDVNNVNNVNIIESKVIVHSPIWTLYFDGAKSKEGAGAGCLLVDPQGNKTCIACRMEFSCTNNTVEYEALIQGLKKAIDLGIKELIVFGDSKITVRQVRNSIHCLSEHLQSYQREVWNLISHF